MAHPNFRIFYNCFQKFSDIMQDGALQELKGEKEACLVFWVLFFWSRGSRV